MSVISRDYQKSLSNIAKLYLGLGYSVIPTYGDRVPEKAKVAAINWKIFQMRRAPDTFIDHWFECERYGGLAIVTGRISNLVVIDFDSESLEEEFRQRFPYLLKTRVVKSAERGLSHYYYHMSPDINLSTQRIQGADLLSNGAYAIAPPTLINGKEYKILQGGQPYQLTNSDAKHLLNFFKNRRNANCNKSPEPQLERFLDTKTEHCSNNISIESLTSLYQHYAPQIGRNNALFKVACYGRDYKLSQHEVKNVLQPLHATQSNNKSYLETYESRWNEAHKTIRSAFSHPPRTIKHSSTQLTNSIREALLKLKLTHVARVLDALFLNGFKSGDLVTKKIVVDALKGQVGRHSILATFTTTLNNSSTVFETVIPSPRTPTHTYVANQRQKTTNKKCFLFSTTKSDKNTRGRIPTYFRIPDINVLCQMLGIPFTRSDALQPADIQQARTYRQAVHRELIKRRPSMYHRSWLAQRLGVSRRTCQRYDKGAQVNRQAMYIRQHITWDKLHILPEKEPINGRFLEGQGGKRYPGLRQIAAQLLAQKQYVSYCYQDVNFYWYGDNLPMMSVHWGINPNQEAFEQRCEQIDNRFKQYWADLQSKKHVKIMPEPGQRTATITPTSPQWEAYTAPETVSKPKPVSKRLYKKPLSDSSAERLAQRLYQAIWDRAKEEQTRLSLSNARRLVDNYSESLIHRALGVLKYRTHINNPAGFIIVWLRSTAKGV